MQTTDSSSDPGAKTAPATVTQHVLGTEMVIESYFLGFLAALSDTERLVLQTDRVYREQLSFSPTFPFDRTLWCSSLEELATKADRHWQQVDTKDEGRGLLLAACRGYVERKVDQLMCGSDATSLQALSISRLSEELVLQLPVHCPTLMRCFASLPEFFSLWTVQTDEAAGGERRSCDATSHADRLEEATTRTMFTKSTGTMTCRHPNIVDMVSVLYEQCGRLFPLFCEERVKSALCSKTLGFVQGLSSLPSLPWGNQAAGQYQAVGQFETPRLRVCLLDKQAVMPSKQRATDVGWDVTILRVEKVFSTGVTRFDTGIAVQPPPGWYCRILPRSSFSQTGWVMVNSEAVIDPTYIGPCLVALYKLGPNSLDLPSMLPFKGFQITMHPVLPMCICPVSRDQLVSTKRSEGGFGSTDSRPPPTAVGVSSVGNSTSAVSTATAVVVRAPPDSTPTTDSKEDNREQKRARCCQ